MRERPRIRFGYPKRDRRKGRIVRKKRRGSILLTLALALSLLPWAVLPARAIHDPVTWSGTKEFTENTTIDCNVTCDGDVELTIAAGVTLTIYGTVSGDGTTLTVNGPGTLNVTGSDEVDDENGGSGIQGGVTVNGGALTAHGGDGYYYRSGTAIDGAVTLCGGTLTATGGSGSNSEDAAFGGAVTVAEGWVYTDGMHNYTTGSLEAGSLAGKTLAPCVARVGENYYTNAGENLNAALSSASGSGETLTLLADVKLDAPLIVQENQTVTLDLNGHAIDRGLPQDSGSAENPGNVLNVYGTLTLTDSSDSPATPEYDGTGKITGGNNQAEHGCGGVNVVGTLHMNGGAICGNRGMYAGGVYVGGTFNMNGGTISGNSAKSSTSGGGVRVHGGSFTMTGGEISRNTVRNSYGGGVRVSKGTFTMEGGTISGNYAGNTSGGGVYVPSNGTFILSGGTITGNSATNGGGGVRADQGKFRVSGSPVITGNVRGGVFDGELGVYTGGTADDVYVGTWSDDSVVIDITGALTDDAQIGVWLIRPRVFTSGWKTHMAGKTPDDYFVSNEGYEFKTDESGELTLYANWPELQSIVSEAPSGGTVTLEKDYGAVSGSSVLEITDKDLTLDLNGHTIDVRGMYQSNTSADAIVCTGGRLTLTDTSADGTGLVMGGRYGVHVKSNGTDKPGAFELRGGTITGSMRSGVYTADIDSTFTMSGGTVRDCCIFNTAGAVQLTGAGTMSGGEIANSSYYGLKLAGSGSSFTMSGGTVKGCKNIGVYVSSNASFTMNGGAITGNTGLYVGGVSAANGASFTMNGGAITDNAATDENYAGFGGVFLNGASLALSGKVTVTGNAANGKPADVFVYSPYSLTVGALDPKSRIGLTHRSSDTLPVKITKDSDMSRYWACFFENEGTSGALALYDGALYFVESACTVAFDSNGGSEVAALTVPQAGGGFEADKVLAVRPADPTKKGFTFIGWYAGESDAAYDFNTPVTGDLTLTARWSKPVTSVALNKTALTLTAGGTETLSATITPADATDKSVTWTSSDKKVATVNANSKVTALKAGTATITVKTADGSKTATCDVSVTGVVSASVSGTKLTYSLAGVPSNAKVVAAWYNASGKMLGMTSADAAAGNSTNKTLTVGSGAATYKLMLVDKTTYAPLCEAWSN